MKRSRYGGFEPRFGPACPLARRAKVGGAEGIRTPDPHNAIVVLYQLSYDPNRAAKLRVTRTFVKKLLEQTASNCALVRHANAFRGRRKLSARCPCSHSTES